MYDVSPSSFSLPLSLLFCIEDVITICFCFSSYVAPEYASTGMLNERSDMYSFGILIMEIISARNPVDYSRPPDEVCTKLLDHFLMTMSWLSKTLRIVLFCLFSSLLLLLTSLEFSGKLS